ncbi:MAG: TrbI/VirB10 family protein [Helicobacteraceae bacterium]
MSRQRIYWLLGSSALGVILIALLALLNKKEQRSNSILVTSGYEESYIPKIKKKEEPKKEEPPAPQEQTYTPPPEVPMQEILVDERLIANSARTAKTSFTKYTHAKSTAAAKASPVQKSVTYADDFGLAKDEAENPVKLDLVITADRFIPVILKTAVSSEIPGGVIASVEEDIYSAHLKNLLIPKGSTVFGDYKSLTKGGQSRLALIWTRILTPDGINIRLTSAASTDIIGRAGAVGEVDNKMWERYGIALTLSTVTSALSYLAFKGTKSGTTTEAQINNNLITNYKNDIGQITNQILRENLQLAPVVNLKIGQRLFIKNSLDIWFNKLDETNIEVLIKDKGRE